MSRRADPYTMNQNHIQPAPDDYIIGGPSDFAEDVNPNNRWEDEYEDGQVARNEIGMPEMRPDTFDHSEKIASMDEATLLKKASICVRTARLMLPRTATEEVVEDQAVALMNLPDYDLFETFTRLAGDEEAQQEEAQQQTQQGKKQAQQQVSADQIQAMIAQEIQAQQQQAQQQQAQQQQAQQQQAQQQQAQQQQAQQQQAQQQQAQQQQAQQQQAQQQQAQQQQAQQQQAQQQIQALIAQQVRQQLAQQAKQQTVQANQAPMSAQQIQALIAQQVQQQLAQQQTQGGCQNQTSQQGPNPAVTFGQDDFDDIQMDAPVMDTGDTSFGPEDDVLKTLFANDESQQGQGDQQQSQKQASTRTASTRTVGTRPTAGVSRLGGTPVAGKHDGVQQLSTLWQSAPDVREAFGLPVK
jgi:hypothetical protein